MPTYAEYGRIRERNDNRRKADARDAKRHRGFDLSAQDMHHKHDRFHFAVVGEGSRSATDNFHRNYDAIDWSRG